MSADQKYATLPDLDVAPDVYETPDLTDDASTLPASTLPRPESPASSYGDIDEDSPAGISRRRLRPDEARSHFSPNEPRSVELEYSGRIKSKRKSYKESSNRSRVDGATSLTVESSDEDEESLEMKIARLRREVAEVKEAFEKSKEQKSTDTQNGMNDDDDGLDALSDILSSVNLRGSQMENNSASHLVQRINTAARSLPNTKDTTESMNGYSAQPGSIYTLNYAPNYVQEHTLAKVADFDTRLMLLESILGVDTIPLPTQARSHVKAVLPTLDKIDRQLSVVSASTESTLDLTNRRVRQLTQDAQRLTEARKTAKAAQEALSESRSGSRQPSASHHHGDAQAQALPGIEDPEHLSKINALYGTLTTIESLSPILPSLLDRLRSLRSVHADAAAASQALTQVESRQETMASELRDWRVGLEKVEGIIDQEQRTMSGNTNAIEGDICQSLKRRPIRYDIVYDASQRVALSDYPMEFKTSNDGSDLASFSHKGSECVSSASRYYDIFQTICSSPVTAHLRLALVESQSLRAIRAWSLPPARFSNRASSLAPISVSFLEKIGVWKHIEHERVQPYHHMHVWDAMSPNSKIDFSARKHQSQTGSTIAYMTENANLTRGLLARLDSLEPISSFDATSVATIGLGPPADAIRPLDLSSYPHVQLSSTTTPLIARLLVGADGLNSPVRNFAHIATRGWDYERHGVVATVRLASPDRSYAENGSAPEVHDDVTAYQRFLPSGPIALLALPGDYASLVWSTTSEQAARLKALEPASFAAMVNAAFRLSVVDIDYMSKMQYGQADEVEWRLKATDVPNEDETSYPRMVEAVQEGSVASFPLRMRQADQYVGERVALIGDAAHTIHPLAGQGLNMGLADVASLVRTIEYSVSHGGDIGVRGNLEGYESEMWMKNNRMLGVVDKMHKLYGVSWGPLLGLRALGLGMVDRADGLKRLIMGQAGG